MGEAILHDLATKKGVRDQWVIDSAGTGGHEAGSSIYGGAQRVLKKHGINYEHIARQVIFYCFTSQVERFRNIPLKCTKMNNQKNFNH